MGTRSKGSQSRGRWEQKATGRKPEAVLGERAAKDSYLSCRFHIMGSIQEGEERSFHKVLVMVIRRLSW